MRVLMLDLDTLRPDHLGCYGYHRNTSPNLDRIAAEGVRFDNYYCSDAPCLPSRSALITGMFGIHNGCINHGGIHADLRLQGENRSFRNFLDSHGLFSIFRRAGMHTVSISPFAERHSAFHFYAGFNEMHNTGKGGGESAEEIVPVALDWIERNAQKDNWFLHLNLWDPHTPYRAPEEFGNPFENEPIPDWITEDVLKEHNRMVGPHKSLEVSMYSDRTSPRHPRQLGAIRTMEDLKRHFDGYDCGIAYMDQKIGEILDALERQGVLDDLAIIVTSDHAENQGELGIYAEHATADHANCRIPMIIRWPGGVRGHADKGLHYNIDLAPTLAELFGQNRQPLWDGESYARTILEGADTGREELIISQCAHTLQRGVRFGQWLYIRTYHDGFHLFPDEMLFNIEEDPHEQYNLAEKHPELCREGAWRLMRWYDQMMKTQPFPDKADPLWTIYHEGGPFHARGHLKQYIEYLKKTGREYAIEELMRRHPQEFA
ncbi:MAG: sulfatase [Lentisphaerae bacterium]|nr:MAG: sulfatase [Lentisphaerota bacterium]